MGKLFIGLCTPLHEVKRITVEERNPKCRLILAPALFEKSKFDKFLRLSYRRFPTQPP